MEELAQALAKTFEDFRVTKGEKQTLKQLLIAHKRDKEISFFVRNRAFDIGTAHVRDLSLHHLEATK